MDKSSLRLSVAAFCLCFGAMTAQAQVLQPTAASTRTALSRGLGASAAHDMLSAERPVARSSANAASSRHVRSKPIIVGVVIGALLGAGGGAVIGAAACDGLHCSNRHAITTGALVGAAAGGLFGFLLGLPPKD